MPLKKQRRDKGEGEGIMKPTNKARQLHREVNMGRAHVSKQCCQLLGQAEALLDKSLKRNSLFSFSFLNVD